jgi:hypothetical protein
MVLLDRAGRAPVSVRGVEMTNPFDASLISEGTVGADVLAEQHRKVEDLMQRPNALANAKLHAQNDLIRLVNACNRVAWGTVTTEPRAPTPEETAALLERLSPEDREKLTSSATAAAQQRSLLMHMDEAQRHYHSELQAEQAEIAEREAAAQAWAEFEAFDAAGKEERFRTWLASRG